MFQQVRRFFGELDPPVRRNFASDAGAAALFGLFFGATLPFAPVIAIRLGAAPWKVALITAAPFVGMLFSGYWGHLSVRMARVPLVAYPIMAARALFFALALVHDPDVFVILIMVYYLAVAVAGPAYTALVENIYPPSCRGRLLGTTRLVAGLCQMLVLLVAGRAMDRWGHGPVYAVGATLGVGCGLVLARIREPASACACSGAGRFSLYEQWQRLAQDRFFFLFELGFTVFGFGNLLLQPLYPIYQVQVLHLDVTRVALVALAWSVANFVGTMFWGGTIDRGGRPVSAVLAGAVCYLVLPLAYFFGKSFPFVLLGGLLLGFGDAAVDMGWMNQVMRAGRERVASYAGVHLTLLGVRGTLAPLLGPALIPALGLSNIFPLGAALAGASLIPLLLAGRIPSAASSGARTSTASPLP